MTAVGARGGQLVLDRAAARRQRSLRALLAVLAVSAAFPGLWSTLAPGSFYASFPLGGTGWVAPLGPAAPHFIADTGAFYLAFAGLFAWATWRPDPALVVPLSVAWAGFSALHFGWHATHLAPLPAADAAGQTLSLGLVFAMPAWAVWLARRPSARPQAPAASHSA